MIYQLGECFSEYLLTTPPNAPPFPIPHGSVAALSPRRSAVERPSPLVVISLVSLHISEHSPCDCILLHIAGNSHGWIWCQHSVFLRSSKCQHNNNYKHGRAHHLFWRLTKRSLEKVSDIKYELSVVVRRPLSARKLLFYKILSRDHFYEVTYKQ